MRSEFEKWFDGEYSNYGVGYKKYYKNETDSYVSDFVDDRYSAFQAGYQHQQSKVDEMQKQRDSFIKAYDIEMGKNIELQKRVDAAKYYMKNIFSGDAEVDQCHLGDMLDILDGKIVDELEQALKGGE